MIAGPSVERFSVEDLQVSALPDRRAPAVVVHLALRGGSRLDPPGRSGLGHLCEHFLFAGLNPRYPRRYPQLIRRVGGAQQALTWFDRMAFTEILPAHQLSLGVWLAADRLRHCGEALSTEVIEREREVLLQERRQFVESNPEALALEAIHRRLYASNHPFYRSPMGLPEEMRTIDPEEVPPFLGSLLDPARALLVVVGDFDTTDLQRQLERYAGEWQGAADPGWVTGRQPAAAPDLGGPQGTQVRLPEGSLYLVYSIPNPVHKPLALLTLYLAMQIHGAGVTVVPHLIEMDQAATLILAFPASTQVERGRLRRLAEQAVDGLLAGEVNNRGLRRARASVRQREVGRVDRWDQRAEWVAETAFREGPEAWPDPQRSLTVTPLDLVATAQGALKPQRRLWMDGGGEPLPRGEAP